MQLTDYVSTIFDGHSNPDKVTVAFTMGVNALMKGHTATLILMANAVELGRPDAAADIDIGKPFEPVADLHRKYMDLGGNIVVCGSCMIHNGFTAEDMDTRYPVITAGDVIDLLMSAKGSLQIT